MGWNQPKRLATATWRDFCGLKAPTCHGSRDVKLDSGSWALGFLTGASGEVGKLACSSWSHTVLYAHMRKTRRNYFNDQYAVCIDEVHT